ncbi:MAG TPA: hypothetical protein VD913_01475 [bacterium]|nr:hypothetical protein [bacterium]
MRRTLLMILFFGWSFPVIYAQSGTSLQGEDLALSGTRVTYYFIDHLPQAESFVVEYGKGAVVGIWRQDRFVFPGLADYTQIKVSNNSYEGSFRKGIFFHPIQNAVRQLRFRNVTPGSKLVVYYGIDDAGTQFSEGTVVYLKVWLGNKEVKKIRILNEKGWYKEEIGLGVASFLKQGIVVTFEVTSDNIKERRVSIDAEILP